ncbi:MAG: hypothetical protein WA949_16515 [Phormidesmis sp.]
MYMLKKAESISAVVERVDPDRSAEFALSNKSDDRPDRDLMYLVFDDGTTTTIQPDSIDH